MSSAVKSFPVFHVIAKPVGPICNLDCTYCYYLEKEHLYPQTRRWELSGEALAAFIRDYIAAQESPVVSFTWQGGEPTLRGVDFFREVVALQKKYADGRKIENALQTNGVLLDDGWGEFLASHAFLVGLSIDGPEHFHDAFRLRKNGRGTFAQVLRGLGFLRKHGVEFNTLTVVNRQNGDHPLDVYQFLKDIGSRFLQFLPAVERISQSPSQAGLQLCLPDDAGPAAIADWSVQPEQFGRFMCDIFDHWVQHDVAQIFVQLFDVALENWLGLTPALCVFRETCGAALAVEHNGDVYSCDHFVNARYRLGNLLETPLGDLANTQRQVDFGLAKRDTLPRYCRECDVRFACHGECPKHRFAVTPDGEPGLNYLCAGYKQFFHHINPFMSFMANELRNRRPPANVMEFAKQQLKSADF